MRAKKNIVVADSLTNMILDGKIKEGEKLPSHKELAKEYNISRSCIVSALKILDNRGLIYSVPGKGVFVRTSSSKSKKLKNVVYLLKEEQSMVSNDVDNFGIEIMWGIESELRKNKINFLIKKYSYPDVNEEIKELIDDMDIDGVIIDRDYPENMLIHASFLNIPAVVAGKKTNNPVFSSVLPNYYDYFNLLFSMLDRENYRDVCFFYSASTAHSGEILKALENFNSHSFRKYYAVNFIAELRGGRDREHNHIYIYSTIEKMIKNKKMPEVFVCDTDWTAFRIIEMLNKNNIKVPDNVKIIGCLGLDIAFSTKPIITTFKADAREIGKKSVQVLKKQAEINSRMPIIEKLPLIYIERETFTWKDIEVFKEEMKI